MTYDQVVIPFVCSGWGDYYLVDGSTPCIILLTNIVVDVVKDVCNKYTMLDDGVAVMMLLFVPELTFNFATDVSLLLYVMSVNNTAYSVSFAVYDSNVAKSDLLNVQL